MNKINLYIASAVMALSPFMTGCSDFTDVKPKGSNLLSTTSDIELLLNYRLTFSVTDMMTISGDLIQPSENFETMLSRPNNTASRILITWDEAGHDKDLAILTPQDAFYTICYTAIGTVCNPALTQIETADGPENDKARIKAEALVLRAYCHYLVVQKFAKAYNPATAENDSGILYITEDLDILSPTTPKTLKQTYECIQKDLDDAIALNALPDANINRMRFNLPFAYAVKAMAYMATQEYDKAAEYANKALAINNTVVDYNRLLVPTQNVMGQPVSVIVRQLLECEEDYYDTYAPMVGTLLTPYCEGLFEQGHISHENLTTDVLLYGMSLMGPSMGISWPYTIDQQSSWNAAGLKASQMYLILAETAINNNRIDDAMDALDKIRVNRIHSAQYQPLKGTVSTKADAIEHLRQTAHGENAWTMFNFVDRKRWTVCPDYRQTLTRNINGHTYTLTPESSLWVFPFPMNLLDSNPNMKQNY